jgi:hypothetical protein
VVLTGLNNKLAVTVFEIVKPAHVPHEKNGEQPVQSFALLVPACSVFTTASQSLSVQQGFTDNTTMMKEKIIQSSFTQQKYQLKHIQSTIFRSI